MYHVHNMAARLLSDSSWRGYVSPVLQELPIVFCTWFPPFKRYWERNKDIWISLSVWNVQVHFENPKMSHKQCYHCAALLLDESLAAVCPVPDQVHFSPFVRSLT